MCLYYNQGGCRYGNSCRYIHDDKAVLEGTWEPGKSWDNASRKSIRDEGFHRCCFDYYLNGRCRVRFGCRFSHDEMSEERLTRLKYLANVANQVRFQRERGLEIPDRSTFQPPAIGGAESSSSSAPQALQMTNVSKEAGEVDTLDGAEGDVQKDSVAESTAVRLQNPEEPIESWMARNQHLWVYTHHVSDVMIKLGVTNVKELQEYIFVEDLVEKGVNKVTACKILELVGGVCYRPMSPDVAVSTNASVRMERSSGSREAGVNPPKKGYRSRSNPVKRGRPLLDRKQVRLVPRSHSNRRVRPAEVVEKPKPLKPRGGLSYRFSKAWADVVDDDDQAGALVSYAESSGDSSEEETNNARHLWETFLRERDSQRTEARGNVPLTGSPSSNEEQKKSIHLGEERDKASRGETRQEVTSQVFSLSQSSLRATQSQKRARDGSVIDGSLAVGSTDEVLPGQGVAGQVNISEGVQVLPGQDVAGQETALEGAVQIPGDETEQQEGEGGSNELRGGGKEKLAVLKAQKSHEQLLAKGLLKRIYWKVAAGRLPVEQKDCPKGSNKMDRNLVISMSSDGASEQELNLALVDDAGHSMDNGTAIFPAYDPQILIQSPTTEWVTRRGLADRAIWTAIAASARKICAEMNDSGG